MKVLSPLPKKASHFLWLCEKKGILWERSIPGCMVHECGVWFNPLKDEILKWDTWNLQGQQKQTRNLPAGMLSHPTGSRLSPEQRKSKCEERHFQMKKDTTTQKTLAKGTTKDCTSVQRKLNAERISHTSTIKRQRTQFKNE